MIYSFWGFIALGPVLNPRRLPLRFSLAIDIIAGLTAALIIGLLSYFAIGLFQLGLLNTRGFYDAVPTSKRVIWNCLIALSGVLCGLCVRLILDKTVRPFLKHCLDQRTIQAIKEHHRAIMKRINNKPLRDLLASKQRQLRVEKLRILEGNDPGATASGEAIAAEMRSLSNDAVKELIGHLDTVARAYKGLGIDTWTSSQNDGNRVTRARFMTGGGYRLLASASFEELVLGCIEAKFCK